MKKLLTTFTHNNILYELFGEDNKIIINKIGHDSRVTDEDTLLCIKILKKIIERQNIEYNTINYNNEIIDVIYDSINKKYCFKKDGVECDYNNYKNLYDSYNSPIFYSELKKVDTISYRNEIIDVYYNSETKKYILKKDGVECDYYLYKSIYDLYNSPTIIEYKANEPIEFNKEPENKRVEILNNNRNNHNKTRKIFVTIGGITLALTVFLSSWNLWLKNITDNDKKIEFTNSPTQTISELTTNDYTKQIEESLTNEEQWVLTTTLNKEQTFSSNESAQLILNGIRDNEYISDYYKDVLLNSFGDYINKQVDYMDNEQIKRIADELSTVRIIDNQPASSQGITAEYNFAENTIYLYSDFEHSLTHEVLHLMGKFSVYSVSTDYVSEGFVELHNPNRNKNVYSTQQNIYIILERIYGKQTMYQSFYNECFYDYVLDRFGDNVKEHWALIKDVNTYLATIGTEHTLDIRYDDELLAKTNEIVARLKAEYELVTGLSWENDEVLLAVESALTGINTLNLDDHDFVYDIYPEGDDYSFETVYRESLSY